MDSILYRIRGMAYNIIYSRRYHLCDISVLSLSLLVFRIMVREYERKQSLAGIADLAKQLREAIEDKLLEV